MKQKSIYFVVTCVNKKKKKKKKTKKKNKKGIPVWDFIVIYVIFCDSLLIFENYLLHSSFFFQIQPFFIF